MGACETVGRVLAQSDVNVTSTPKFLGSSQIVFTGLTSAEPIKYASSAYLAQGAPSPCVRQRRSAAGVKRKLQMAQ